MTSTVINLNLSKTKLTQEEAILMNKGLKCILSKDDINFYSNLTAEVAVSLVKIKTL